MQEWHRTRRYEAGSELSDELIATFALAHRGKDVGAEPWTKQANDYRQKLSVVRDELAERLGRPTVIGDLGTLHVDFVLATRLNPATGKPLAPSSRNAYRRIVRSFLGWLTKTGQVTERIQPVCRDEDEDNQGSPTVFTLEEVETILAYLAANDSETSRRLTAQIMLALDSGPRRSDILSLTLAGIDRVEGTVHLRLKGGKERTIPVSEETLEAIDRYLAVRSGTHARVFLSDAGRPQEPSTLSKHFANVLERVGLRYRNGRRRTFHALRRTWVRQYRRAGRSEQEVAAMAGWTVEFAHQVLPYYDRPDTEDLKRVHASSSPLKAMFGKAPAA